MKTYSFVDGHDRLMVSNQIHSLFPIIQAVIEGVQQGEIFRNTHGDYWVLHKAGFSEVFLTSGDGKDLVDFIIGNNNLPKYFHLYNPVERLVDVFKFKSEIFNIRERARVQLKYDKQKEESGLSHPLNDEFVLTPATRENSDSLAVFNLDLENKFWSSKEDFVDNALAVFIKDKQNKPVSLCYAAAVAGQKAEIDVITSEDHREKKLAKSVVAAFISNCINKKIIPNWDCFEDNVASMMTAKKLNFSISKKYKLLSIFKKI